MWVGGIIVAVAGLSALLTSLAAFIGARDGARALEDARVFVLERDVERARASLAEARDAFSSADARLSSPLALPLRLLPWVSRQASAATALARGGALVAGAGLAGVDALDEAPEGGLAIRNGAVDLRSIQRSTPALAEASAQAQAALRLVEDSPSSWLLPQLSTARGEALRILRPAAEASHVAHRAAEMLPTFLGQGTTKRYYLAFANLAELRGAGGFIGFYAVIEVEDGRLRLDIETGTPTKDLQPIREVPLDAPRDFLTGYSRYEPTKDWQNINLGLDFPTAGDLITQGARPAVGPLDGVIQIDSIGVEGLLELTGPVQVEGWPEPIGADNITPITQHDMYEAYEGDGEARDVLVAQIIEAVFAELTTSDIDLDADALRVLDNSATGGHIRVFSHDAEVQDALESMEVAGHLDRARSATDVVGLHTVNAAPSKADWFLRRDVDLDITLDPLQGQAVGRLQATLRNRATPRESDDVVGTRLQPRGANRQVAFIARTRQGDIEWLRVNQEHHDPLVSYERSLNVFHAGLDIPPEGSTVLTGRLVTLDAFQERDGELVYRLHLLRQPIGHPDNYDVDIAIPKGWGADGPTSFSGPLHQDQVLELHLHETLRARIVSAIGGWGLVPLSIAAVALMAAITRRREQERERMTATTDIDDIADLAIVDDD